MGLLSPEIENSGSTRPNTSSPIIVNLCARHIGYVKPAGLDSKNCDNVKSHQKQMLKNNVSYIKHLQEENVKPAYKPFSSNIFHSEEHVENEGLSRRTRAGRTLRNRKYRRAFEENRQTKRLFTPEIKKFLKSWLVRRRKNPYPNRNEKKDLAEQTGLTYIQICNWFANWRRKLKSTCSEQDKRTWGHLIKDYNTQVQGNVEQFSITSDDSIWDESAYKKESANPGSSSYPQSPTVFNNFYKTDKSDYETQPTETTKYESEKPIQDFTSSDQTFNTNSGKQSATNNLNINPNIQLNQPVKENKMESPILLSKWLESAEKFRPCESYIRSSINMTWQNSVLRQLPKTKGYQNSDKLLLGRHREELDAAEALTYLSYSPSLKFQRQFPAISGH